jgi:hypothetical protein
MCLHLFWGFYNVSLASDGYSISFSDFAKSFTLKIGDDQQDFFWIGLKRGDAPYIWCRIEVDTETHRFWKSVTWFDEWPEDWKQRVSAYFLGGYINQAGGLLASYGAFLPERISINETDLLNHLRSCQSMDYMTLALWSGDGEYVKSYVLDEWGLDKAISMSDMQTLCNLFHLNSFEFFNSCQDDFLQTVIQIVEHIDFEYLGQETGRDLVLYWHEEEEIHSIYFNNNLNRIARCMNDCVKMTAEREEGGWVISRQDKFRDRNDVLENLLKDVFLQNL